MVWEQQERKKEEMSGQASKTIRKDESVLPHPTRYPEAFTATNGPLASVSRLRSVHRSIRSDA